MTKFMSKSNNCNQSAIIFRIILCSGISLVLGAVLGHLLRTELFADINAEFEQILLALDTKSIHYPSLFRLCTSTQFKQLFLLCFFSLTNAWVFYLTFYCLYTGFRCGLLLSFCLTHNVHSGFFDFLCFLLPHCLLYIPAYRCSSYAAADQGSERQKSSPSYKDCPFSCSLSACCLPVVCVKPLSTLR